MQDVNHLPLLTTDFQRPNDMQQSLQYTSARTSPMLKEAPFMQQEERIAHVYRVNQAIPMRESIPTLFRSLSRCLLIWVAVVIWQDSSVRLAAFALLDLFGSPDPIVETAGKIFSKAASREINVWVRACLKPQNLCTGRKESPIKLCLNRRVPWFVANDCGR